ncbi:MAG: hypothetical protein E6Z15_01970 [Paenibacillus macerans]|nr:hypothetical protein [Paenibacillus macerans]
MSTPILLSGAIKRFIEGVLADYVSEQVQVHEGYLPTKTAENIHTPDYPYVIVRLHTGDAQDSGHTVSVLLYFGTKSEDDEGFKDVLNVMEHVRIALLKQRVIENQFRMELPYTWELFEGQPQPEWVGMAKTKWTLPAVLEEVHFDY